MTTHSTHGQRGKSAETRFFEKVEPQPNGCHLWRSAIGSRGYGIFWVSATRRSEGAHRFAYELANGKIPEGLMVMHACDTPACVNPAHLSLGTAELNMGDAKAKGRLASGERNGGGGKLTRDQAREIRDSAGLLSRRLAAKAYGVSEQTIKVIRRGTLWREPTTPAKEQSHV